MNQRNISVERTEAFETLLSKDGYFVYTVKGFSMMPLLRQKRDVVEIRKKGTERCKKYDVVLYKRGQQYILHRILKVRQDDYVIAGDHNTYLEYGITDNQILGVMTRIHRNDKDITVDSKLYRSYVHLWCDCYPVRMWMIKAYQKLRRIGSKLKHKLIASATKSK